MGSCWSWRPGPGPSAPPTSVTNRPGPSPHGGCRRGRAPRHLGRLITVSDLLHTGERDGVSWLTMDDGKANVLSFAMFEAINAALDDAESNGQVVVLAGRPGRFSGGFDLAVLTSLTVDAARLLRTGFELSHRLLSFPRPVVVACTGHAYAMGSFLVLSGDYRLGAADAEHRITANEVSIGMTLPYAAIEVLRQRLTRAAFERAALKPRSSTRSPRWRRAGSTLWCPRPTYSTPPRPRPSP